MSTSAQTRLTITLSKQTDRELRAALGAHARRKGSLSKFIEDAVRTQLFDRMITKIKDRNTDNEACMRDIDDVVNEVRRERAEKRVTAS